MKRLFILLLLLAAAPLVHAQILESRSIKGLDATSDGFVYFNLSSGEIVAPEAAVFGGWDIAFQGTNIQVSGSAQYMDAAYDSLNTAPDSGYLSNDLGPLTLPSGGTDGWFDYDFNTHVITPVENRILLIKTQTRKFVKLEILDYYKSEFSTDGPVETPRYYSFRYLMQKDGSRVLTK
jgi:hypothetical protein